ncbi:hypothetical protein ABVK25_012394 [Lepraria finkii]|uniref:Uncharacterized protein n=1 Tax=Lepraria finkii TaxID=1340010 RepID=A0ABR4AI66_9LECA
MVAQGLHDELEPPGEHYAIPIPTVWVSVVTKMSYRQACEYLYVPNLSVLQLEPIWLEADRKTQQLSQGILYSSVKAKWAEFAQLESHLRQEMEVYRSVEWTQSTEEARFSLLVELYCDSLESQYEQSLSVDMTRGLPTDGSWPIELDQCPGENITQIAVMRTGNRYSTKQQVISAAWISWGFCQQVNRISRASIYRKDTNDQQTRNGGASRRHILPQRSLLTASSSERHALIDVPSIAERNQGRGDFQSRDPSSVIIVDDQGFVSDRSRVSHSPSPPQALLVSENLFHNIRVYFENSCRNMILDDHGTLLTPDGTQLHNRLCNDFDSYCFTATILIEKGLNVEFRHTLSKASTLVKQILQAEHPQTLACFLEVFIHLMQTGLPEVAFFLRDFIKRMSAKVTKKGNPWGQICWLLGELDSASLDQAMAQIWKCTTDTFDSELGAFSRLAVSVRLDYVKRVYGITNYLEEERLLRDLLAQFEGTPRLPTPRVMLNLAHNLNRQGRHDEAEEMALKVLSLLQECEIYAKRIVERIESLKIVSRSQFNQGKALAAEQTIREAIRTIVDQ